MFVVSLFNIFNLYNSIYATYKYYIFSEIIKLSLIFLEQIIILKFTKKNFD